MSDEIVLFHNPMSRGRIAHWMLEEVGAPYRLELIRFDKNEHKSAEFLAMNPMGKIPTLLHRGVVITEAAAICTYLADAFPQTKLAPAFDEPARGTYLRWLFFAAGCVEPAVTDHMFARPPVDRKSAVGYGSYEDTMRALEQAVTPGPFILGERFSAADVYVGSAIGWGMHTKGIPPQPAFTRYLAQLSARPAYKRFSAKTDELVAQLEQATT